LIVQAPGRRTVFVPYREKKNKMDEVFHKSRDITLLEILDRALDKGVVISGDIVISVADVDLVYLGLKVLLSSVENMERLRGASFSGALKEPT